MKTYLSRMGAALFANSEYQQVDWFDLALRRFGGVTKAAKLIRVSTSQLHHYREHSWSSLTYDQMMNIAHASGVPILGLIVQCNREVAAERQRRGDRTEAEACYPAQGKPADSPRHGERCVRTPADARGH